MTTPKQKEAQEPRTVNLENVKPGVEQDLAREYAAHPARGVLNLPNGVSAPLQT
jgi:hypothetical protein